MAAALLCFSTLTGLAYTTEEECEFAESLATDFRMPDYAMKALDALELAKPAEKAKIIPSRVLVLDLSGKLKESEALLASLGKGDAADAARIAHGTALYRSGDIPKAKEIFAEYFKNHAEPPKDPTQLKAFRKVCSQFGAMMKAAGDPRAAVEAGRRYLKTIPANPPEDLAAISSAIRCDMAVLLIEAAKKDPSAKDALLKEGEQICAIVEKDGVGLFWGQAIVAHANMIYLRGDRPAAQKFLKSQMDLLPGIDEQLALEHKLGESPMAGVLMLDGQINEDDAKAALAKKDTKTADASYQKAFKAYFTVFVKYGDSDYGLDAGVKVNEIKKILTGAPFNRTVKTPMTPEQETKVLDHSFRIADQKMREKAYDKAIPEYLKVLKDFPESDRSVRALGSVLRCYAESDDKLMVKVTARYIGERFHKRAFAADLIRGLGRFYLEKKDEAMFYFVCDTYISSFPKDPNAGAVLLSEAALHMATNDFSGGRPYLEKIISSGYTNDAAYGKALGMIGMIYMMESNFTASAESYKVYAESLPPSLEKIIAQSKYADALRLSGKPGDALPIYAAVADSIKDPSKQLLTAPNADVRDKAKDTFEHCLFYVGICHSRMTENVDDNRQKAIAAFEAFLKQFPGSTNYAPRALAGRGQVFLQMDKFDDASKVFQELAQKYPNSPEGKNALISLVQSALEIKRLDQAKKAFAEMTKANANVTVVQYIQMGQVWLDNGVYPEAALSFGKVVGKTTDRNLEQPALFGFGKAQFENKQYKEAADALTTLVTKYDRTPYFFDAKLLQSASFREIGKFKDAMDALSDIMVQPSATLIQKFQAQYEIALLQDKQGQKKEALASCIRNVDLSVLGNESNPANLGWIEKFVLLGIRLAQDLQRYDDVVDMADGYAKLLPAGKVLDQVRKAKADAVSKGAGSK